MNWIELIADLKARGYSQPQIAERCGCVQSTISDLATGKLKDPRHAVGEILRAMHAKARRKKERA